MRMSETEFQRQYEEATHRGDEQFHTEPRAVGVRFDRRTWCVVIKLNKASTLSVDAKRES